MNSEINIEKEEYFYKGIQKIVQSKNMGYLSAFYNSKFNQEGISFTLNRFKEVFQDFDIISNWDSLPDEFLVYIKYSPINLFKRWIITISNHSFFKVYERAHAVEKEFFLYNLDEQIFLFALTTNITHERFLLSVYTKKEFKESNIVFTTQFSDKRKLVIYKDYRKRKVSTINFPRNFLEKKPYTFRISVIKNEKKIRLKVHVNNHDYETIHSIKLNGDSKSSKGSSKSEINQEDFNNFRKEVTQLLEDKNNQEFETNKFANVSLGRVAKIPVLINLSSNYANIKIHSVFNKQEELLKILDKNKKEIKVFAISLAPKSNWLERK